jgi:hypothetical protein
VDFLPVWFSSKETLEKFVNVEIEY